MKIESTYKLPNFAATMLTLSGMGARIGVIEGLCCLYSSDPPHISILK